MTARGIDLSALRPLGRPGLRTWLLYEPEARRVVHRIGSPTHVEASPNADDLRRDRSLPNFARAIALYHLVVEATLAQPGQHYIEDFFIKEGTMPGFSAGMVNVSQDEQRHIGFGVKLLRDLAQEDPDVPLAVADLVTGSSTAARAASAWIRGRTDSVLAPGSSTATVPAPAIAVTPAARRHGLAP